MQALSKTIATFLAGSEKALTSGPAMKHIDPKRHPRLHAVSQGAKWGGSDAYPAWPWVADETEEWLKLIETRLGQAGLDHYTNKLREPAAKRNEFLVELATAYFLDTRCGLSIVGLEPPGSGGKTGEFLFGLPDEREMFVEVKSPGWEGEVEEEESRRRVGPRPKGRLPRLDQPKYRHLEGRAFHHTQRVRDTVAKAYPKMPDTMPTLLVISDDLFVSLTDGLDMVKWALFAKTSIDPSHEAAKYQAQWTTEDGCFVGSQYERLGAVAVFNFIPEEPYRYSFALLRNPHALETVRVPAKPFSGCPLLDGPDWPGGAFAATLAAIRPGCCRGRLLDGSGALAVPAEVGRITPARRAAARPPAGRR